MYRLKRWALLVLAAITLTVAGCGGGNSSTHTSTTLPAPSSSQSATGSVHPPEWGLSSVGAPRALSPLIAAPTAEMFDTITLSTVPAHPFALAGYTAGHWPTFLPLRHAWPTAHTISIAISWRYRADCLDVEPGDASPSQAGAWARADITAGFSRPCLYADLSEMSSVRSSLAAAGLSRSSYFLWLAWYRFVPGLVPGYDAVQWSDHAFGRNLDESTVSLTFLTIAHPPYVAAKTTKALPVCFTHRVSRAQCAKTKAQVANWQRGADASARVHKTRHCDVLAQRERWFAAAIKRQPHSSRLASRKRALEATRRAERRRACSVFAHRSVYFNGLIAQAKARN